MLPPRLDITQLLNEQQAGDEGAGERVMPLVYDALRRIAENHLHGEQHATLSPTALVHEAYERMVDLDRVTYESRRHFFALASRAMRRILVDRARKQQAAKRGARAEHVAAHDAPLVATLPPTEILALDDALTRLEALDERKAKVVHLRFFGGFTVEETAEIIGVASATVRRDWTLAKAWLRKEMTARTYAGT
jgi:RNA polymerase sigma factor (TIGR02999 family)